MAMPVCLLAAGGYAIAAEEVAIPGAGAFAGARDPALDHASSVLTGPVADGFGIGLLGLAILLHCHLVWRRTDALLRWAGLGLLAGCLVVGVGVVVAILG